MTYMAPRHIMVAASDRAECTALRSRTVPIAPARATGPRIQNAMASPRGTSLCMSGPEASVLVMATELIMMLIGLPSPRQSGPRSGSER